MDKQFIILCLQDTDPYEIPKNDWTYVQTSRRRFSEEEAKDRLEYIAKERRPVIVEVPPVLLDEEGYPKEKR